MTPGEALLAKTLEGLFPAVQKLVERMISGTPTPPPAAAGKKDQWTKGPATGRNDHIQEAEIIE